MIPKIIHYCWFGRGPLPELAQKCIASWRKYLPDYEIREWNEDNFDVNIIPYTAEAYCEKKYAFVSDYARFWILYKYGGIYFDTDVEVIRPIDDIIARGNFMGFETDPTPQSAVSADASGASVNPGLGLGVAPGLGLVKKMLDYYDGQHFVCEANMRNQITVVHICTKVLLDNGLQLCHGIQCVDGVYVYPAEYFCPINVTTGRIHVEPNTRTIHHYAGTWVDKKFSIKETLKSLLPESWVLALIHLKKQGLGQWKGNCRLRLKVLRRNLPFALRRRPNVEYAKNELFFVIAPGLKHPGLADRLKAIVNCYNIAKMNGYRFRIVFKQPYPLEDYLQPADSDWHADFSDLHYSVGGTRFFNEMYFLHEDSLQGRTALTKDKEYHCYSYVGNRQPKVFPESGYEWSRLYCELFRPSLRLQQAIDACGYAEKSYVAVHLRFVNALEHFETVTCCDNALQTEQEKLDLIARCKQGLMRIKAENDGCPVLVFSDSKRFLDSLDDMPVAVLDHDNIGHMSDGADDGVTLKTFVDLYMIARAKKVYRIDAPELYAWSGFAMTAAMIGGIDFVTIKV